MGRVDDIVDRISDLVDEQLAAGEDFGSDQHDTCWHCGRDWHGLALTERMAHMYAWGCYDESYRFDEDDTEVVCPGSEFIGPRAPRRHEREAAHAVERDISVTILAVNSATGEVMPLFGSERGFPRSPNAAGLVFVGPGGGGGSVAQSSSRLQGEGFPGGGGRGGSFSSRYGGVGVWSGGAPVGQLWRDARPSFGITIGRSVPFDEGPGLDYEVGFTTDAQMTGEWLDENRVPHRGDDLYTNSEER